VKARPLIVPAPSPLEAAAIVAALERFGRDTAAPRRDRPAAIGGWLRVARLEAVGGEPSAPAPWGERAPWPAGAPASGWKP
jgi:hypothetical protein